MKPEAVIDSSTFPGGILLPPPPPAPPPPPPQSWLWRNRVWLLPFASLMFFAPLLAAIFLRVPYYLISPGEARPVAGLIEIKDGEAQVYDPEGHILFTTVSLAGDVNALEALRGWLDDDIEVVPERQITGGAPRQQVRELNIAAMDTSKLTATKVALERLGYRVSVDGKGALVTDVKVGDPADGKLDPNDVITAVDGQVVTLHDQVVALVRQHKPGDTITLHIRRGDREQDVSLQAIDAGDGQARIGVVLQTFQLQYNFPIEVSIDTGVVGGPSAGLAFTLAIIDELSPGELTGGGAVAVTGTIDSSGAVGVVGGVAQKTVTARRAGAVAFLVPPEEEKVAKVHAGGMKIVPVRTLDEALAALEDLGGSRVALPEAQPVS